MSQGTSHRKQVRINEATVTLRNDGIVHVLFHKKTVLDLPLQMLLLAIYKEVTSGVERPFLFEAMEGIKVTAEAKRNALRIEDEAPGIAYAVVAPTIKYRMIANFYVKMRKPKKSYKVFSNADDATAWLYQFLT